MNTTGKFLVGVGVLTVLYLYGKNKIDTWKSVLPKLKAIPTKVSNIRFDGGKLKFNLDLTIYNPTTQDFNPDIVATLKRVVITEATGRTVAEIGVNKSNLYVPAQGRETLKGLSVEIPIASNLENLSTLLTLKASDFKARGVVGVLGSEYFI